MYLYNIAHDDGAEWKTLLTMTVQNENIAHDDGTERKDKYSQL